MLGDPLRKRKACMCENPWCFHSYLVLDQIDKGFERQWKEHNKIQDQCSIGTHEHILRVCECEESPYELLIMLQGKQVDFPSNVAFIQPLLGCIVA